MKKRSYKRMKNRLYREIKARITEEGRRISAEGKIAEAQETAEYYKGRFRKFGTNVDTIDLKSGNYIAELKWELTPESLNKYMWVSMEEWKEKIPEYAVTEHMKDLAVQIAEALIENNLVQFSSRDPEDYFPLANKAALGAKLYVVPWEQMPHKRTMELRQMVDAIYNDREGIL